MRYIDHKTVEDLKVTYIGGGNRGWAWELMSYFADVGDISGEVCLCDIDYEKAAKNVIIGNCLNELPAANPTGTTLPSKLCRRR